MARVWLSQPTVTMQLGRDSSRQRTFTLGLGTNTMRSSRVFTLVAGAAFIAACGSSTGTSNTAPAADFTFACSDLTCTFTDHSSDTDGSIASQAWDFGDGSGGTGATSPHTYAAAGTYNVKVTATDNDGASTASTAKPVTVTAGGAGVQAAFTVLCTSLDCAITNTSTPNGAGETYAWDFGDGTQTSTATADGIAQAEQEWRIASRGRVAPPSPAARHRRAPAIGGVEIAVRYVTRASDRFALRARLYQSAVQLLAHRPAA